MFSRIVSAAQVHTFWTAKHTIGTALHLSTVAEYTQHKPCAPSCRNIDFWALSHLTWEDICKRFAKLSSESYVPDYGRRIDGLGKRFMLSHDAGCPACNFWRACRPDNEHDKIVSGNLRGFELRAYSTLRGHWREEHPVGSLPPLLLKHDTIYFHLNREGDYGSAEGHDHTHDRIYCHLAESAGPRQNLMYLPGSVSCHLSVQVVQEWIDHCQSYHATCNCTVRQSSFHMASLRVINVKSMRMVRLPTGKEYLALSYVWGRCQTANSHFISGIRLKPDLRSVQIPTTIADAIHVTLALGYKYLWVDRFSLSQLPERRALEISRMDTIFGGAAVTICAVTGRDADAGLPGVRATPRTAQTSIRMGEVQLTKQASPAKTARMIQESPWA